MDIIEKGNVIERKSGFPSGDVLGSVAGRIFVRGTAGIDLQDYVDSVVKAFTIEGVLTFVPPKYSIYSYFVNAGMADKTSLITALILVDFERMQEIYAQYGDDIIIKGYVTADGRSCNSIGISAAYSIVSTSDCKEGAWEFIKFSLTNNYSTDFPSNKRMLQEMIDEELAHAGEEKRSTFYTEQGPVNYHYATQEEIDTVMNLIENVELPRHLAVR